MYSPKIDQHTPTLYRLSKVVRIPMTKVADDLLSYALSQLPSIYSDLNDKSVSEIRGSNRDIKGMSE